MEQTVPYVWCWQGWTIDYCESKGKGVFVPNSYKYYGQLRLFRLPAMEDAVRPNRGQYAVSGDCKYILDSSCDVQRGGLSCYTVQYSTHEYIASCTQYSTVASVL